MQEKFLEGIGLTPSQAKIYITLVKNGKLTPPEIAKLTGESRTNAYMVLDKLIELKLVKKVENSTKLTYMAENPSHLEDLARTERQKVLKKEEVVKSAMPELLSYFYTFSEQPGVRFFQGADDIKEIYDDILKTGKTLYLIRSVDDKNTFGQEYMNKFIKERVKRGISVKALTPYTIDANKNSEIDKAMLFDRTWVGVDMYNDPVEIDIYGDKLAFISYGEEAIGLIIESPQIANSMRSLFKLIRLGARLNGTRS